MADNKEGALFCISCWFTSDDHKKYREHYSSEWHCFNLERKRQRLPHVTEEVFQKILAKSLEQKKLLEAESDKSRSWHCGVCSKRFKSNNSYENHLSSKKHLTLLKDCGDVGINGENTNKKMGENSDGEEEEEDDEEWTEEDILGEPIPPIHCFFCNKNNEDIEKNLKHMSEKHTFFLPDIDYLVDVQGLLTVLGEKVGKYHICLWCNDRSKMFLETRDVQLHMNDKGHCKVYHEGDALLEYSDFYDYRKAYPDYKGEDDVNDDDDDDRLTKPEALSLDHTQLQLILPSGSTVGHRSLNVYFKQKLDPNRQVQTSSNKSAIHNAIMHYKSMGWQVTSVQKAATKARDLAFVERKRNQMYLKQGIKHNGLQKHFRKQYTGC